ncbi:inhibitor of apoptosis repeat-containing protein [Thelephora terrestris]|uniref:Inhibitor of apoptosis repeat-containing protein n=1 Tax=Thelephora terrestris TaxID=56493 RepID=A0A9P6HJU0_9AGAM|nr:inhibitor of apoptosis repeat-containing protein [Thelephora terrestris]
MFNPIQRQESFKSSRKIAKNPTSKTLSVTVKWPHPKSYKANPSTLADAGFYWNPNSTAKDNVSCFFCEENFSDWEVHFDPHVIHYDRCGESCAWAIARCGVFAVDSDPNQKFRMGNDPDRLPCGKFLENHRYTIFVHGDWPHDKTKGHKVTSRKMAGAGFIFTPHETGDDTAKCPYCGIELSGWDPDDDPVYAPPIYIQLCLC